MRWLLVNAPNTSIPIPSVADRKDRQHRAEETHRLLTLAEDSEDPERQRLLDHVVLLNTGLAEAVAARYRGRGVDSDDLSQVAYLGLVKAVHGFSTRKSTEFVAYAVPTIRGEVKRHFRDAAWAVRPPRRTQELHAAIAIAEPQLMQRLHRPPTVAELAAEVGAPPDEVVAAQSAADAGCFAPLSLDAPATQGSPGAVNDLLGALEEDYDRVDRKLLLQPLVAGLRDRERRILELRFEHEWSQERIGAELGVSQMQISRLLREILGKLRAALDEAVLDGAEPVMRTAA
ncbi:MAG TPA: sigma-70 family RNA polymerase sigma factor [Kribbellaceae bacterium]